MKRSIILKLKTINQDKISPKKTSEKLNNQSLKTSKSLKKFDDISDLLLKSVVNKKKSCLLEKIVMNNICEPKQESNILSKTNSTEEDFLISSTNSLYNLKKKFSIKTPKKTVFLPIKEDSSIKSMTLNSKSILNRSTTTNLVNKNPEKIIHNNSLLLKKSRNFENREEEKINDSTRTPQEKEIIQKKKSKVKFENFVEKIYDITPSREKTFENSHSLKKEEIRKSIKFKKLTQNRSLKTFYSKKDNPFKNYQPPPITRRTTFKDITHLNNFLIREKKFSQLASNNHSRSNVDLAEDFFFKKERKLKKSNSSENFQEDLIRLNETKKCNTIFTDELISDQILNISANEYEKIDELRFLNQNNLNRIIKVKEILNLFLRNKGRKIVQRNEIDNLKEQKFQNCKIWPNYKNYCPLPSFLKSKFKNTTIRKFNETENW